MSKKTNLVLTSGSWLPGDEIPIISKTHAFIRDYEGTINAQDLKYRTIKLEDLPEFKDLEREWFPSYAGDPFYDQIVNPNILAVGCFWCPPKLKPTREILLAAVMIRYQSSAKTAKYTHNYLPYARQPTKWQRASKFCTNYNCCFGHILTIGVIDEARRLGIAGELMKKLISYSKQNFFNMIGFSLHVFELNTAAIRCYEKNGYKFLFDVPGYYDINSKWFAGKYYIKPIPPAGNIANSYLETPKTENMNVLIDFDRYKQKAQYYEIIKEVHKYRNSSLLIVKDLETEFIYGARVVPCSVIAPYADAIKKNIKKIKENDLHPGILRYYKSFIDARSNKMLVILTENWEAETIVDYISKFDAISEERVVIWIRQICECLNFIRFKAGIYTKVALAYRNIQLSNIMVNGIRNEIKIDFLFNDITSLLFQDSPLIGVCLSPEEISGFSAADKYTDAWAFGCISYFICTHKAPFTEKASICESKYYISEIPVIYGANLRTLIKGLLQRNKDFRITIDCAYNLLKLYY